MTWTIADPAQAFIAGYLSAMLSSKQSLLRDKVEKEDNDLVPQGKQEVTQLDEQEPWDLPPSITNCL